MIAYEVKDRVATLTITRPEVKNALGPEEWQSLDGLARRAAADPEVRVLVITGAGGVFSAGGDLKSMPERLALPRHVRRANLLSDAQVVRTLRELPKVVIAMIEGACVGAGLSLALACDVRIAAANARLGAAFHKVGLTGDFGLLWLLPRIVGPTRAMDLLLRAEIIDAARAETMGLLTRVVPTEKLAEETYAYAALVVAGPPLATAFTKRGLYAEKSLPDMLAWEAEAQAACSKSEDAAEGVKAFLERRPAKFQGR